MKDFSATLISWYKKNKRDLPWRDTQDAYKIWLSEIILQQTRVEQGRSYYEAFTTKFPTVKHLAKAPLDVVMKTWQGLGYYSRARNLHATANIIVSEHKSVFPDSYVGLIKLKGIGPYTAAAIASFAFDERVAVVDGNVYRVLSRYFGIETPIDSNTGKIEFLQLANELISIKHPGTHNQAIMEFGALQCKPQNPDCLNCPLNASCAALAENKVNVLPIKEKKTKVRNRYFYYLIIEDKAKQTLIKKRIGKDIWTELFEFPLIETEKALENKELLKKIASFFGKEKITIQKISESRKHILSHQHIYAQFVHVKLESKLKKHEEYKIIKSKDINSFALPRLIDRYLHG
ncbi:MAG: A/G-specific adenine glycosylase [Bacteroidota bacterium]|nr:A/G-specific adenine glycosylase [Bacteroidota bacterium]